MESIAAQVAGFRHPVQSARVPAGLEAVWRLPVFCDEQSRESRGVIVTEIGEALTSNMLPRRDGQKLRERLQFASTSLWETFQKTVESSFQSRHDRKADSVTQSP